MTRLTADLPGIGGTYKETAETFQVEEIPLYPCCGAGEHLYLWIEKSGITTRELIHQLARGLKLNEREIGYAGLKDARALTRQMISVPATKADPAEKLNSKDFRILKIDRHSNKLRLGHLAGNRFTIRLQDTVPEPALRARPIIDVLARRGVPNLFGEQRYGVLGNSARLGMLLLQQHFDAFCSAWIGEPELIRNPQWKKAAEAYRQGDLQQALADLPGRMRDEQRLLQKLLAGQSCRDAVLSLPRNLLRLFLSAAQAALFDRLVLGRMPDLDRLVDGDIAYKHNNGACFRVANAATEQPRADGFDISPTAPLFGSKTMMADGTPGKRERALLLEQELSENSWKLGDGLTMTGERRPMRVPLTDARIIASGEREITMEFTLPKGSYATSVLGEIMK